MANILLGISGGIAAYKSAELVRLLTKRQYQVRVMMTAAAQNFITPLTFQALSGQPVSTELLDADAEAGMGHIELARWADLIVIAPTSANTIAKITHGLADNLLTSVILASQSPLAVAPAMNQGMWRNAATQANIEILVNRGVSIWGPAAGEQACGDVGPGRMLEPEQLAERVDQHFSCQRLLINKHVMITAGPTREPIDPVRYISNHSSGKMGFALAQAARDAGARVTLVKGPTLEQPPVGVEAIAVSSADEMLDACQRKLDDVDIFIAAAAVADYKVSEIAPQKLKKRDGESPPPLPLVQNPDILATVAKQKPNMFSVGFAAETENLLNNARQKLARKNLHMIIANDVSQQAIGFNSNDNQVTVITPSSSVELPKQAKIKLAQKIVEMIAAHCKEQTQNTVLGDESEKTRKSEE